MCTAPLVQRSASVEGMGRVKFRTLKDLYDGSVSVSEPAQIEEKSRKCNLSGTRSSSCMDFERVTAIGVGTGDFTNEAFKEKKSSRCSSTDSILFSQSLNSVCDCGQHTSSEASNVFSVSSSHESFSEIAESQATARVPDPREDIELVSNIGNAQPAGESGDSPKGLIKFDNKRFSIQLEKHKDLDILVDNVSCISGSDNTYLTIAGTYFDKADDNHHNVQNLTENPPLEGVVYPNFYDCIISPKGEPFDCSGEQVESSPARGAISGFSSQIDGVYNYSTFRRDGHQLNCEDSAIETESHLYCKKHLQKSPAVIKNTSLQGQSQPIGRMGMSDLMEDEVRVCDICGDVGREELLAVCCKCTDGAEHIYCMRIKLDKVPEGDWICEECILRADNEKEAQEKVEELGRGRISRERLECQKSESSVNLESKSCAKVKPKSSCVGRTGTNDVRSTFLLSAKRDGAPLQAQFSKKAKTIGMSAVLPRSSEPCNNPLLHRDTSSKNLKGKMKATKEITSRLQLSCNTQEKAKVSSACGDKRQVGSLKAELDKKKRNLEAEVISPKASSTINNSLLQRDTSFKNLKKGDMKTTKQNTSVLKVSRNAHEKEKFTCACAKKLYAETSKAELNEKRRDLETESISPKSSNTIDHSLLTREPPFKNLEKVKIESARSISSLKPSSDGTLEKAELPSILGDESANLCSQTQRSQDKCTLLKSRSSNSTDLKLKGQLTKGSLLKSRSSNAADLKLKGLPAKGGLQMIARKPDFEDNIKQKDPRLLSKSVSFGSSMLKSRLSNAADLKLKGQLENGGSLQNQMVARNPEFQDNKRLADPSVLSKSLSFNSVSPDKLNAGSEVLLTNADLPEPSKMLNHAKETKIVKGKNMSELLIPAMCSPASDPGVTTSKSKSDKVSSHVTFISESNWPKLDSVQSCGLLNGSLKPSNITPKPASDEGSKSNMRNLPQFDAAIFSQGFAIPKPDYIWLGKFQLHSSDGIASSYDGIQAHLSTFASRKVLEVVDKLPEIIVLEELPRLRTWPSQFIQHAATEENIALYFFATDLDSYGRYYRRLLEYMTKNDLALRGNLDGVELLIFPSNLLPEKSQRWNKLLFLWGVFRGRKVDNSTNIPLSNCPREENRDGKKRREIDLNAYPDDEEDTEGVDEGGKCWIVNNNSQGEIHKFDMTVTRSSGDGVLHGGDGHSSGFTFPGQALDKGENRAEVVDLDLALWPKNDGGLLSTGIAGNRSNEEVHGKVSLDVAEASGSHEQNFETKKKTKQLLLEWQAADTLISLSKGFRKI